MKAGRTVKTRRLGLAMGLSLAMLAASLQAAPASAQTTTTDQGGGLAATQAANTDQPVLIPELTTYTTQVFANPDGTRTAQIEQD